VKKKKQTDKKTENKTKSKRSRPISLHPLTPEEALGAFMKTSAKKKKKKRT